MTHHYNSNITPHGFSYCRGGVLTDPVPEPDLWFSHIRLFDDSCPDRARPCSLGFLCWGFKPPSKGPRCVPRPCSQSHLIKRHRPSKTCRSGRPSPSRWSLLLRQYFGTISASDSLSHPLARDGPSALPCFFVPTTGPDRVSLGQYRTFPSAPSLTTQQDSQGCSPIPLSAFAGTQNLCDRGLHHLPKVGRHCQATTGSQFITARSFASGPPDSTLRWTPCHCWLSHLNGVICRSRTFTCKLLYLPVAQ